MPVGRPIGQTSTHDPRGPRSSPQQYAPWQVAQKPMASPSGGSPGPGQATPQGVYNTGWDFVEYMSNPQGPQASDFLDPLGYQKMPTGDMTGGAYDYINSMQGGEVPRNHFTKEHPMSSIGQGGWDFVNNRPVSQDRQTGGGGGIQPPDLLSQAPELPQYQLPEINIGGQPTQAPGYLPDPTAGINYNAQLPYMPNPWERGQQNDWMPTTDPGMRELPQGVSLQEMAATNVDYPTMNYGVDWQSLQGGLAGLLGGGGGGQAAAPSGYGVDAGFTMPQAPGQPGQLAMPDGGQAGPGFAAAFHQTRQPLQSAAMGNWQQQSTGLGDQFAQQQATGGLQWAQLAETLKQILNQGATQQSGNMLGFLGGLA